MNAKSNHDAVSSSTILCGIVPGEKGLGAHFKPPEREYVAVKTRSIYEKQPPFWYPRTDWPGLSSSSANDVKPTPMGRTNNDGSLHGVSWNDHVQEVHNFLETMESQNIMTRKCLEALERIMIRGIESAVGIVKTEIRLHGHPSPSFFKVLSDNCRLPKGSEVTDMDICSTLPLEEEFRQFLFGRRFWVVKFQFVSSESRDNDPAGNVSTTELGHWATALFDRRSSTFIYFDTRNYQRGIRAKAAGLAWRAYLANMQLSYDFYLVSPPLTEQPSPFDAACLSFYMVYQSVRSHVGQGLNDLFDTSGKRLKVVFDGKHDKKRPPTLCDVRIRDWGALGDSPDMALATVVQLLTAICLHEVAVVCRRPRPSWLRTISVNRYRTLKALDTLVDSIDFGGPLPMDMPDGRTQARGHPAKRMFERRSTPQRGWYDLPPVPPFINAAPSTDMIPDEETESYWKGRNSGCIPPEIRTMRRHNNDEREGVPGTKVPPPHDIADELCPAKQLELPDMWCGSTAVSVNTLNTPPWCPPRNNTGEWRSIWADMVSISPRKAAP